MANLYRKKSLEKLSSPEQLDQLIVINSPLTWISLIGGGFIIIVTILWAILGRVPITEEGKGVLLRSGNLTSVYSKTKGVVTKSYVSSGEKVEEGDILYEVNSEETAEALLQLEERIENIEEITLTSEKDEVTNDTQVLLEIKEQIFALDGESRIQQISLSELERLYNEKKAEADTLKADMESAKARYYHVLTDDESAKVEYEYSTAGNEYQIAETEYKTLDVEYQNLKKERKEYSAKLKEAKKLYKENKKTTEAEAYLAAMEEYQTYYDKAKKTEEDYLKKSEKAKGERDTKEKVYEEKKHAYESYINLSGSKNAEITRLSNEYNNALSLYSGAKTEVDSYKKQIESTKGQERVSVEENLQKKETLLTQFDTQKQVILDQLNKEMKNYELLKDGENIIATVSGTVYTTFVTNGSSVMVDSEVVRINTDTEETMYAVYYMTLETGKNVKKEMNVNIYPTNVSKEEFGHMKGKVVAVANYVTSYADLFTKLGDETLASTFSDSGAVVEVLCEIEKDSSTTSGYVWSSKKGASLEVAEGTLLSGSIITKNVAPITMFIPKLKEKFNLE